MQFADTEVTAGTTAVADWLELDDDDDDAAASCLKAGAANCTKALGSGNPGCLSLILLTSLRAAEGLFVTRCCV